MDKQLRTLKPTSVQQLQTMIEDMMAWNYGKKVSGSSEYNATTYETMYFSSWWNIQKVLKMIVGYEVVRTSMWFYIFSQAKLIFSFC